VSSARRATKTDDADAMRRRAERTRLRAVASRFTVFLDRDGVFNVHSERGILHPTRLVWLPGARAAFARLNRPDVQTALCTNQPRVGALTATPGMVKRTNGHLRAGLAAAGGRLDHIEAAYAPPWWPHRRRKPRPGMLEDAAEWFAVQAAAGDAGTRDAHGRPFTAVDKARAVMVGDKPKDAQAGNAFGVPAILVATTYPRERLERAVAAHGLDAVVVADLAAAVDIVLKRAASRP
jgi:D-glycero-D-manno-heptose 1,7-bisphosphate phosphatase